MSTHILKEQSAFEPQLIGSLSTASSFVCGGMGGSALHARVLRPLLPEKQITVHADYGLPQSSSPDALYIATSYSGETEETLSFFREACARGYATAVIASGGTLLNEAKDKGIPYIEIPTGRQPRDSFLVLVKALLYILGEERSMEEWSAHAAVEDEVHEQASALADSLENRISLVYTSVQNEALGYIAKITLNETAKVPAFSNVFPELNHNEIQGLDPLGKTAPLSDSLAVVLITDTEDFEGVQKRMRALEKILTDRSLRVVSIELPKGSSEGKVLWAWMLVRETAHILADRYGVEADPTPLIEDFKKLL
ncbi:hypothetical protein KKD81_02180 [Patescibacteria group bacterium]|nr:hypothetical protein [Patescibacteria group bacterium]